MRITFVSRYRMMFFLFALAGCAAPPQRRTAPFPISPTTQPTASLPLDSTGVRPMYRQLLSVDLPAVTHVAMAQNIDIQEARQRVAASQGRYESSVEAIFPVIAPAFTYQHLSGPNQNANGTLVLTNFNNLLPAITVQWIINPAKVYYDIVASRRRMESTAQQADAVRLETARTAALQYYDLVYAQAQVRAAQRAVAEADESLRVTTLRVRAGNALAADEVRARAFLAGRRQDLLLAVNTFYQASLNLTVTLHLDPVVTLVPQPDHISQTSLVREDLTVEQLLALAVRERPDLASTRTLLAAAEAEKGGVVWGALGPQLQAAYTVGALQTDVHGRVFHFREQQRASATAGFALGLSTFGQMKTADADLRSAALDAERQLDRVRADVVAAQQESRTSAALIPIAREQVDSADEALRLTRVNLDAGQMLLIDVLQSESEADAAHLRYAGAVVRYNQSQVKLLAAVGLLNEQTLLGALQER